MKITINKIFHHTESNDIILCIIVDGNYKQLIQQIKNSCLFAKKWENWTNINENEITKNLFDYFEILRKANVPFLIVYCSRFYERTSQYYNPISKKYLEDEKIETEIIINNLKNDNEILKHQVKEQNNQIQEQNNQIQEQNKKIKELEEKIALLIGEGEKNLLGKKVKRIKFVRKKLKKEKIREKGDNDDEQ